MGTNYYFEPIGFDQINKINEIFVKSVEKLKEEYERQIEDIIDKNNKEHSLYRGFFRPYFDTNYTLQHQEFYVPDVHICKLSYGWVPLFEQNKYYSNIEQFKYFCETYQNDIVIKDEYDRVYSIEKFLDIVYDHLKNNNKESHLQYNNSLLGIKYTKDPTGIEWANSEFS